jgi:hypothetical protein
MRAPEQGPGGKTDDLAGGASVAVLECAIAEHGAGGSCEAQYLDYVRTDLFADIYKCVRDCRRASGADTASCLGGCLDLHPEPADAFLAAEECVVQACGWQDEAVPHEGERAAALDCALVENGPLGACHDAYLDFRTFEWRGLFTACLHECRPQNGEDATSCRNACIDRFPTGGFAYLTNLKCTVEACSSPDDAATVDWGHVEDKPQWYPWVEDCNECSPHQVCAWASWQLPHPRDRCVDVPIGCEDDLTCECVQPCVEQSCNLLTGYFACG